MIHVNLSDSPRTNAIKTLLSTVWSVSHQIRGLIALKALQVSLAPTNNSQNTQDSPYNCILLSSKQQVWPLLANTGKEDSKPKRLKEMLARVDDAHGSVVKVGKYAESSSVGMQRTGLMFVPSSASPIRVFPVHCGVLPLQHLAQD